MHHLTRLAIMLLLPALPSGLFADRLLNWADTEKKEIHHSMLGFRDTLVFYTFAGQQAVLTLQISNKDSSFPVTATVYLFEETTTAEAVKKWINNQHSDGLFVDAPEPVLTEKLPQGACKAASFKLTGRTTNPGPQQGTFGAFEVSLEMQGQAVGTSFQLAPFTDTATVYVQSR